MPRYYLIFYQFLRVVDSIQSFLISKRKATLPLQVPWEVQRLLASQVMVAEPNSSYPWLHVTCAEDKYVVSFAITLPFLTAGILQLTAVHRQITEKNRNQRYVNY